MIDQTKKVFISYSSKDKVIASDVRDALATTGFEVWLDIDKIKPGESISSAITKGINASDYLVILISENSNKSHWVQHEIALAFELVSKKKLSVIPILLSGADVPFEFRGLLYIDARKSVADGIKRVVEFFQGQISTARTLVSKETNHGMAFDHSLKIATCESLLNSIPLGELRRKLTHRLSIGEVKVLWFDVFCRKMDDEVPAPNVALGLVELIDRSRREGNLFELIQVICANYPDMGRSLA